MPNHAAKASAEVFMSRIGEERTAVGQHAHKTAEQPLQGECVHLALHAIELIVEPPSAAKLNLPCLWSLLEVAYHGGQHLIVGGIDAVENGLCQHALTVQSIQESGHRGRGVLCAYAVISSIRSQLTEHARVAVAHGTVMELLRPATACVHPGQFQQEGGGELFVFALAYLLSAEHLLQNGIGLCFTARTPGESADTVIGESASFLFEEVMPLLQCFHQCCITIYPRVRSLFEPMYICQIFLRLFDGQGLVGPPGGQNLYLESTLT